MYKKIIAALLILLLALTGCGTSNSDSTGNGSATPGEVEEVSDIFEVELTHVDGMKYKITLTLASDHEQDETITFPSTQRFNYSIKKGEEVLYNYAANKLFGLMVEEKVLKPGETLEFEMDVTEALPFIEAGKYMIEAWITAENLEEEKATIEFEYDGKMPQMEATVTYNGQIDPHSIEVTTEDGEVEVYQLVGELQTKFSGVKEGATLKVQYTINDIGQKVIESFEVVE